MFQIRDQLTKPQANKIMVKLFNFYILLFSGWDYDNVLRYFKKSEDMTIPELKNSEYHGKGGYLTIEKFKYFSMISQSLMEGGRELGYEEIDVNGDKQTGFTRSHGTLRNGLRSDSSTKYSFVFRSRMLEICGRGTG